MLVGRGSKPPDPPQIVEPIAVQDAIANGVSVFNDGMLCWLTFWVERRTPGSAAERVVTSKVCVPSAQYPKLLRMMGALPPITYEDDTLQ